MDRRRRGIEATMTPTDNRPAENGSSSSSVAYLLLVPFFFSGAAALIAQLGWLRTLTVTLGGSSTALNIILITFMAGLAIGARLAAKKNVRKNA